MRVAGYLHVNVHHWCILLFTLLSFSAFTAVLLSPLMSGLSFVRSTPCPIFFSQEKAIPTSLVPVSDGIETSFFTVPGMFTSASHSPVNSAGVLQPVRRDAGLLAPVITAHSIRNISAYNTEGDPKSSGRIGGREAPVQSMQQNSSLPAGFQSSSYSKKPETYSKNMQDEPIFQNKNAVRSFRLSSDQLLQYLRIQLAADPRIDESLLALNIQGNQIMSSGLVFNEQERSLLASLAADYPQYSIDMTDIRNLQSMFIVNTSVYQPPAGITDQTIRQRIRKAMFCARNLTPFTINVTVNNGEVELTGTARTFKAGLAATKIAQAVPGVKRVTNKLEVPPIPETPVTEVYESEDRISLLDKIPLLQRYPLHLIRRSSGITLTGFVSSYFEKWLAGNLMANIPGVSRIENRILVMMQPTAMNRFEPDSFQYQATKEIDNYSPMRRWNIPAKNDKPIRTGFDSEVGNIQFAALLSSPQQFISPVGSNPLLW